MVGVCSSRKVSLVKQLTKRVFLGQALAFLMSLTGVSTTFLVNNDASYPLLQSVTSYAFIAAVYVPLFLFVLRRNRNKSFANFHFFNKWWKYAIVAIIDLEANYCVVMAYQYTDMMSVQILDCFTVPCVLVLSFFVLKMRFAVTHIAGCVTAIGGLILLVVLDADGLSRSGKGVSPVLGDMLCLLSSVLYATSNVLTEWFIKPSRSHAEAQRGRHSATVDVVNDGVRELQELEDKVTQPPPTATMEIADEREDRGCETDGPEMAEDDPQVRRRGTGGKKDSAGALEDECSSCDVEEGTVKDVPVYIPVLENLAIMSSFALVFAVIQFFALEWRSFAPARSNWTSEDWVFQMVFGLTMLFVYTGMPTLFILTSAAFANISLLTADVYAIIWNVAVFRIYPTKLFFLSYVVIVVGILLYNLTDVVKISFCARWNYPCGDTAVIASGTEEDPVSPVISANEPTVKRRNHERG